MTAHGSLLNLLQDLADENAVALRRLLERHNAFEPGMVLDLTLYFPNGKAVSGGALLDECAEPIASRKAPEPVTELALALVNTERAQVGLAPLDEFGPAQVEDELAARRRLA